MPNVPARQLRARGPGAARRRIISAALVAAWVGVSTVALAESASADPLNLVVPAFSPTNAVQVSGERTAGNSVEVYTSNPAAAACTVPAASATTWSCTITMPNGAGQSVTAREKDSANADVGSPETKNVDVLGPPALDGAAGTVTTGLVSGSGYPGAIVSVSANGSTDAGCSGQAIGNGYWSCTLRSGSGQAVIQARQSHPGIGAGASSAASGSLTVMVDKDAPSPPAITSPRHGARITSQTVAYVGKGEAGAAVALYIDNVPACSATADGAGNWSCSVRGTANGRHTVLAIQRDAAGNYGSPSAAIRVTMGPAPSAAPAPPPAPAPSSPTPTPTPSAPTPAPSEPDQPAPPAAGRNWGTPTDFGTGLPTPAETLSHGNWWFAPIIALAFLLLVAIPLRLAVTAMRGRVSAPFKKLFGRNQAPVIADDQDEPRPVNPWLAGAVPLAAAAVFIVLAGGVNDELRYLRLTAAVAVGLALLNVVVALAGRVTATAMGIAGRLRFLPILLLAAALTAVLTRLTGMEPPMLAGVLIGLGLSLALPAKPTALTRLSEVGAVALLAIAAWLVWAALGVPEGFWATMLSETLAAVTLAGLGSALVMVLPLGRLPGAALLRWSKGAWAASVLVVGILAAGILLGDTGARFPVLGSLLVAGAVAAISVAIWSWDRFVEPAPR